MALLHKACYDLHMKIKRGRQILSTAQNTLTVYDDAEMGMEYLSNMLHTKPVCKDDSPAQHARNQPLLKIVSFRTQLLAY